MKNVKSIFLALVMSALLVVVAACGNNEEKGAADSEKLSGEVRIDGSSTVAPIMEAVAEEYLAEQPDVKAPVGVSGTGGGMEKFTKGETDLSNASRPMKDEEKKAAEENGIEFLELNVAYDGISVVVNKENDFIDQLTLDELRKIFLEESEAKTWADVREGWPNEPIKIYSPGTDSGTYDYFDEVILEEKEMKKDAQRSEDDNVLVTGVSGDKNAIGFFGFAYYEENKDKLKVIPIVGESGKAVEPTKETINNGEYAPLSRPLFTYVNVKSLEKAEVKDFIDFMNENAGDLAEEVGYVKMPEDKYEANKKAIEDAVK